MWHRPYLNFLEREVDRLRQELATERAANRQDRQLLIDRLCAKQQVPESPAEQRQWMQKQLEEGDLFQEEVDVRKDNREPVDELVGDGT